MQKVGQLLQFNLFTRSHAIFYPYLCQTQRSPWRGPSSQACSIVGTRYRFSVFNWAVRLFEKPAPAVKHVKPALVVPLIHETIKHFVDTSVLNHLAECGRRVIKTGVSASSGCVCLPLSWHVHMKPRIVFLRPSSSLLEIFGIPHVMLRYSASQWWVTHDVTPTSCASRMQFLCICGFNWDSSDPGSIDQSCWLVFCHGANIPQRAEIRRLRLTKRRYLHIFGCVSTWIAKQATPEPEESMIIYTN